MILKHRPLQKGPAPPETFPAFVGRFKKAVNISLDPLKFEKASMSVEFSFRKD
jgi:hypothetical protein